MKITTGLQKMKSREIRKHFEHITKMMSLRRIKTGKGKTEDIIIETRDIPEIYMTLVILDQDVSGQNEPHVDFVFSDRARMRLKTYGNRDGTTDRFRDLILVLDEDVDTHINLDAIGRFTSSNTSDMDVLQKVGSLPLFDENPIVGMNRILEFVEREMAHARKEIINILGNEDPLFGNGYFGDYVVELIENVENTRRLLRGEGIDE